MLYNCFPGVWVCSGKVHIFSALVFDLKFVPTASLQKISIWRPHSDWKTTLSLYAVGYHWMVQLHLGSRQDGAYSTGCIGLCNTCTSTSLQLQLPAHGNESSSIHLNKHTTPVKHYQTAALCMAGVWHKSWCKAALSSVPCDGSLLTLLLPDTDQKRKAIQAAQRLNSETHGGCVHVMSKSGNSCLCTRLPLHGAVTSLTLAAQNCSLATWEASSA